MKIAIGHSDDVLEEDAIAQILESCERQLGDHPVRGGFLACSPEYEAATILQAIRERWPDIQLVGGTSDGEISSSLGFCDDSILLILFAGEDVTAHAGLGHGLSEDPAKAVESAFSGLEGTPRLCLSMFSPMANAGEVVRRVGTDPEWQVPKG